MINRVVLVGRLTKDVELKYTQSNKAVASFTLAVNGYKKDDVDWISIVCWEKQAENVSKYCHKGSLVGVDGSIKTRNYEAQDGKKVYITEVLAQSVKFLDSKPQEETNKQGNDRSTDDNFQEEVNKSFNPFDS